MCPRLLCALPSQQQVVLRDLIWGWIPGPEKGSQSGIPNHPGSRFEGSGLGLESGPHSGAPEGGCPGGRMHPLGWEFHHTRGPKPGQRGLQMCSFRVAVMRANRIMPDNLPHNFGYGAALMIRGLLLQSCCGPCRSCCLVCWHFALSMLLIRDRGQHCRRPTLLLHCCRRLRWSLPCCCPSNVLCAN